jgi:hemin uptake protein HemP
MSDHPSTPAPSQPATNPAPVNTSKLIDSRELLEGRTEILIQHDTEIYRLRLTRNGKLILQK